MAVNATFTCDTRDFSIGFRCVENEQKSLVSQVNVVFTAFKAGILTAFCQPLFAYLAVCENSKRNFDEPS